MFPHLRHGTAVAPHHREHVGGRDATGEHFRFVADVHAVDEVAVPVALRIEMRPETAVDEGVDQIAIADEEVEAETLHGQWQDVLGAYALEAYDGAIPVAELGFVPAQLDIVAIGLGQFPPVFLHDLQRLGQPGCGHCGRSCRR